MTLGKASACKVFIAQSGRKFDGAEFEDENADDGGRYRSKRTGIVRDFNWADKANLFGDGTGREGGGTEGESLAGVLFRLISF